MKKCIRCGNSMLANSRHDVCKECTAKKKKLYLKYYRMNNKEQHRQTARIWAQDRRWLDGGPDNRLMGDDIQYSHYVYNGRSRQREI